MISNWRLITRWHTGTHFVVDMFLRAGFAVSKNKYIPIENKPILYSTHIHSSNYNSIMKIDLPLLTLDRDKDELEKSWIKRYNDVRSIAVGNDLLGSLPQQQEEWIEIIKPTATFILDVTDVKKRDKKLAELSALVGLKLDPGDWVPVNKKQGDRI